MENPLPDYLVTSISEDKDIYLTPTILQEILQGIRSNHQFEEVKESLLAFTILNWNPTDVAIEAAKLYRNLRKKGLTIRKSNDYLIAACARHFDLPILHDDQDYRHIQQHRFVKTILF
ncbi:MAG: PIN domain-containing protein [Bacteroidota bacterium]